MSFLWSVASGPCPSTPARDNGCPRSQDLLKQFLRTACAPGTGRGTDVWRLSLALSGRFLHVTDPHQLGSGNEKGRGQGRLQPIFHGALRPAQDSVWVLFSSLGTALGWGRSAKEA